MKTKTFETREEWLHARRGTIGGSGMKDILPKRGAGKKIGFYELIAERIAMEPDGEDPMERGTRLEEEAIQKFQDETGKEMDTSLVIWSRDDNSGITVSPDAFNDTEAVEVKCLSSARHIEAYLTNTIPDEYEYQVLQYFVVNDDLQKLYFVFYDPRIPAKSFFYFTVNREDVADRVAEVLEYEREVLQEVANIVTELTF